MFTGSPTPSRSSRLLLMLLALALPALAEDTAPERPHVYYVNGAMNADFEFWIYGNSPTTDREYIRSLGDEAFSAVQALETQINYWREDSEISRINREAAAGPVKCSESLYALLKYAKKTWDETEGASDITVGPLVELWGFYKKQAHFPSREELQAAVAKVGMDKVEFDDAARTVRFTVPGMKIDLGGIGKGLAVDRAANVLREKGIQSALLSSGTSSIVAIGAPPGKPGWTVKIRGPYNREESIDEVDLKDASLSTSAGYERFFEIDGKKYCHIFDPKTGMPAESVISVSVIAPTGLLTDALDTGFFVLGLAGTRKYCETHPEVRVVLITDNAGKPEPTRFNFQEKKDP